MAPLGAYGNFPGRVHIPRRLGDYAFPSFFRIGVRCRAFISVPYRVHESNPSPLPMTPLTGGPLAFAWGRPGRSIACAGGADERQEISALGSSGARRRGSWKARRLLGSRLSFRIPNSGTLWVFRIGQPAAPFLVPWVS